MNKDLILQVQVDTRESMASLGKVFGKIVLKNTVAHGLQAPVVAAYGESGSGKTHFVDGCFTGLSSSNFWEFSQRGEVTEKKVGETRFRHVDFGFYRYLPSLKRPVLLDEILLPRENVNDPGVDFVEHAPFSTCDKYDVSIIVVCQNPKSDPEKYKYYVDTVIRQRLDDVGENAASPLAETRDFLMEEFSCPARIVTPQPGSSPRTVSIALKTNDQSAQAIFRAFKNHAENHFPQP